MRHPLNDINDLWVGGVTVFGPKKREVRIFG